jgi:DNA-binding NarL/FixJ family response regulator
MIRLMITDDQEMIRIGLRAVLGAFPDIDVVAEARDGFDVIAQVEAHKPDVVLMDIRMPGIDGVEATRRLREHHPAESLRIIVLTTFEHDENVFAALRAGANGFLNKAVGPDELVGSIREVMAGGGALSSAAAAMLIEHAAAPAPAAPDAAMVARFDALTGREREIVAAIVDGSSNEEIASRLFLSPFTVKTHANRAMMKVGARDRAQLVSFAVQAGIRA